MSKLRKIEIDSHTADVLEAEALARGLSVSDLVASLVVAEEQPTSDFDSMREEGRGPWAPEVLAEDARRLAEFDRTRKGLPLDEVMAWLKSWGTADELPIPKPRKL